MWVDQVALSDPSEAFLFLFYTIYQTYKYPNKIFKETSGHNVNNILNLLIN